MISRHLVLLSPYRLPAQQPLTLADEDMAAWLHGYSALWHPLALWGAAAPPRVEAAADHETPRPGYIYAVPVAPASMLPEDWKERARSAGAVSFVATTDRESTFTNLHAALAAAACPGGTALEKTTAPALNKEGMELVERLAALSEAAVAPFLGLGLGYVLLSALSEAMEHENLLETHVFWNDIQRAVAAATGLPMPPPSSGDAPPLDPDPANVTNAHLQAAALRLLAAREALYPVTIHLLDLVLLEEQDLEDPWPLTVTYGQPVNVIASASVLERLAQANCEAVASLAEAIKTERAEICGGDYLEREDALLPVESQLWNLRKGLDTTRELLGSEVRVFARRRFGAHPQLPTWLNQFGISRAIFLPSPEGGLPAYAYPVMSWSTPDGQQIECFVRKPLATDSADTFFNLGHHLFKTTREDHTATLAFLHSKAPAQPWYGDLLELSRFALAAGKWTTFTNYFGEATAGEHAGNLGADDFHFDHLTERLPPEPLASELAGNALPPPARAYPSPVPVSGFAQHVRLRRRLDTCWTLAALQRGLAGRNDPQRVECPLRDLEDQVERIAAGAAGPELLNRLAELETQIAASLAGRLVAKAQTPEPGHLVLNPCSFTRRLALELPGRGQPIPVVDPVKAVQVEGETLRVVVEVPGLGFAWLPLAGGPGAPAPSRMRLADQRCVRNEFFEAEVDVDTGGLRSVRDHKTLVNRISERLIFRPGSVMKATKVVTTSTGPALGEIVAEGVLLGTQGQLLANYRQRFRAWLGRPILDLRIELYPEQRAAGSPWHAYYGAQFAWRDERAMLLRALGGMGHVSTQARPQTPDYLEIRLARQNTTIFPGGLPFHQREGGRMLDAILVPPGEPAQVFDLAIGLEREQPLQTALGLVTPAIVVPTERGPPHVGAKGWLFHLDAANLVLTSMRPGGQELAADGAGLGDLTDAVTARLLECNGYSTPAELRCVRDPVRVSLLDARGQLVMPATQKEDAALFQVGPGGFVQVQVQFSI